MSGYVWSRPVTVLVDVLAWLLIHVTVGYAAHRLPVRWLSKERWWSRIRGFERDGRWYERWAIRRWKDLLPEAGAVFAGGVDKRRLPPAAAGGLGRFVIETRRAELAHWMTAAPAPLFVLWNPLPVAAVMVVYAVVVNVPCIAALRYNRARIARIEAARRRRLP